MQILTPVALFVYNRPEHTRKTLDALACNYYAGETILFIFSDGPKDKASINEAKRINDVRIVIREEKRFKKTIIIESPVNQGLASSIVAGVTDVLCEHENIIVLEDDILTSKYFLKFCNEALEKYKSENRVMAISGFTFPAGKNLPDTFFLTLVGCWGWATWKDRWKRFNKDSTMLLNEIKKLNKIAEFNFNSSYDYYGLLLSQAEGRADSWAICWHASIFLDGGLVLYPSKSLTQNIGMADGTGTNFKGVLNNLNGGAEVVITDNEFANKTFNYTSSISIDKTINKKFEKYLKRIYPLTIINKLKIILKKIAY